MTRPSTAHGRTVAGCSQPTPCEKQTNKWFSALLHLGGKPVFRRYCVRTLLSSAECYIQVKQNICALSENIGLEKREKPEHRENLSAERKTQEILTYETLFHRKDEIGSNFSKLLTL